MPPKRPQPFVLRKIVVRPEHERALREILRREKRLYRERLPAAEPATCRPEATTALTPENRKRHRSVRTDVGQLATESERALPVVVELVVGRNRDGDQRCSER